MCDLVLLIDLDFLVYFGVFSILGVVFCEYLRYLGY